jgi:hypothetical protein
MVGQHDCTWLSQETSLKHIRVMYETPFVSFVVLRVLCDPKLFPPQSFRNTKDTKNHEGHDDV